MPKGTKIGGGVVALHGFIITHREWAPDVALAMGAKSFGATAGEAWRRHVGERPQPMEFSAIVQRWSEKGYGPRAVKMELVS